MPDHHREISSNLDLRVIFLDQFERGFHLSSNHDAPVRNTARPHLVIYMYIYKWTGTETSTYRCTFFRIKTSVSHPIQPLDVIHTQRQRASDSARLTAPVEVDQHPGVVGVANCRSPNISLAECSFCGSLGLHVACCYGYDIPARKAA